MKRDVELIRKILQRIEDTADGQREVNMKFAGYTTNQVMYNAHLALRHGLIEGTSYRSGASVFPTIRPTGLTWEGHEFLDSVKNQYVWERTKQMVKKNGGSVSFATLREVVEVTTKSKLGL